MKPTKLKLLTLTSGLIVVLTISILAYTIKKTEFAPEALEQGRVVSTKEVICGGKTFVFDIILLNNNTYFNEIYEDSRTLDNFVVRLKSSRGGMLGSFFILTTPRRDDCDSIYLTAIILESDAPSKRIYRWRVGAMDVAELNISPEYSDAFIPYKSKEHISPDGEKVLVAQQTIPKSEIFCAHRTLRLLDLGKDSSEIVVQLSEVESFDNGTSDLEPYCNGLNFGWEDNDTVYYDVYDATVDYNRPFVERRTLSIQ